MSEHEHITRSVDDLDLDLDLTETDLARALATSLDRGHRLVRRRNQRRAAVGGLGAVALLAGGFGVISSLSDGGTDVSVTPAVEGTVVKRTTTSSTVPATTIPAVPATVETTIVPDTAVSGSVLAPAASTTTSPPVPTSAVPPAPIGFTRSELAGGVVLITRDVPPASSGGGPGGGVDVGDTAAVSRAADIPTFRRLSSSSLMVEVACEGAANSVDRVYYRRSGDVVTVQAVMVHGALEPPCTDGNAQMVELTFPARDLPATVQVVVGLLDAE